MMKFLNFWRQKIEKIPKWLWLAIISVTLFLIVGTFWKYHLFAYNALDLAIFNQVFWKTAHGELFGLTIHPHSYLGDHAGLIILALTPIYLLWSDPRTLLLLQSVALILPAAFIWLLVQNRANTLNIGRNWTRLTAVLMSAAWLASPAVHNTGFFEFHLLPFALLPLFGAALAYEQDDRLGFVAWSLLAFVCREDVAFVILMFSFLAWLENRKLWWRLFPFLSGLSWFVGASFLIKAFNPDGGYKFMVYYEWLGHNPVVAATNVFIHPLRTLSHVMTFANLEMALALLMPLAFLPLLKPRRLLIALLPLLQIILGAPGGGQNVTEMHYVTLFLPALFLAAIDGLLTLPDREWFDRLPLKREDAKRAAWLVVVICIAYGFVALGPWPKAVASLFDPEARHRASLTAQALRQIPEDAPVAASYSMLPNLSGRDEIYSLHYLFLGVSQFAVAKYPVPDGLQYLALENSDLITYRSQFTNTQWAEPYYADGRSRLRAVMSDEVWTNGNFNVYRKRHGLPEPWSSGTEEEEPRLLRRKLDLTDDTVTVITDWNRPNNADAYLIRVEVLDKDDRPATSKEFPFLGLPPQTTESSEGIGNTLRIRLPCMAKEVGRINLSLVEQKSSMILDGWRSTTRFVTKEKILLKQEIK